MNDPDNRDVLHPGHHSIRLKGADYSQPGFYLVTLCSFQRKCTFGTVVDSHVSLSAVGRIVNECWLEIPNHFSAVNLLDFVVMPTHLHGIIEIGCQPGRCSAAPLRGEKPGVGITPGSLGAIVRSFKSAVTRIAHTELQLGGEIWQRNYFETILRPGVQLANARAYIKENPQKWEWDRENPAAHKH
jgi:putative transposase